MAEIKINGDRLWASLMEMAKIGATPKGGVCRLTLTDLDKQGRDLFVQWCKDAGCSVKVDQMGNIFARRPGRNNSLAPVGTGSHLDSQPTGGRFDGVYGVLAGLEVIRTLTDHGIETERPVEASVWSNAEGSRFAPAMSRCVRTWPSYRARSAAVALLADGVDVDPQPAITRVETTTRRAA